MVTADLIAQWARDHADHISDGLLTKRTPGLDADITNQAASEAVEAMVRERVRRTRPQDLSPWQRAR